MDYIKHAVTNFRKLWYSPLVVALFVIFLTYIPVIGVGYFADDFHFLNRYTAGEQLSHTFTRNTDGTEAGGSWRPITALSLRVSMGVFENPMVDHLINLGLYLACISVWYLILIQIFPRISEAVRLGATLAVGLLPIHVEPVMWVAARADLLAGVFGLLSIFTWVKRRYVWALVWFGFSLLSKEVWILLPLVWLAYGYDKTIFSRKAIAWFSVATTSVVGLFIFVRQAITDYGVGGYNIAINYSFTPRHIINELIAYSAGVFTFGVPQAQLIVWGQRYWILACFLIVCAIMVGYRFALRSRSLKTAYIGSVAFVVPIVVLATFYVRPVLHIAEQRYWFAPSLALALYLVGVFDELSDRLRRGIGVIFVMWVVVLWWGTAGNIRAVQEAALYRDDILEQWGQVTAASQGKSYSVSALPDTYYGVHLFADPFFSEAVRYYGHVVPRRNHPVYQMCDSVCYSVPLTATMTSSSAFVLTSQTPRLFGTYAPGLRYTVEVPYSEAETSMVWTGVTWQQMSP